MLLRQSDAKAALASLLGAYRENRDLLMALASLQQDAPPRASDENARGGAQASSDGQEHPSADRKTQKQAARSAPPAVDVFEQYLRHSR